MERNESNIQFASKPGFSRYFGWSIVLLCGLGFAVLAFVGARIGEQLLSLGLATILLAVASRMLWMLATIRGLKLQRMTLVLETRNAGAVIFNLPSDVVKISRFGPEARGEIIVEVRNGRKRYRVVTSHYEKPAELREMLAERLHF